MQDVFSNFNSDTSKLYLKKYLSEKTLWASRSCILSLTCQIKLVNAQRQ